jgi:hypothetical protein
MNLGVIGRSLDVCTLGEHWFCGKLLSTTVGGFSVTVTTLLLKPEWMVITPVKSYTNQHQDTAVETELAPLACHPGAKGMRLGHSTVTCFGLENASDF